jgi:hypothetical protein
MLKIRFAQEQWPSPESLYRDLYCARGQDENFSQMVKNDLASDRTSDHSFLANHMRLFFACAAYVLHHALRSEVLVHTELANAQPATVILKLFKLAVRVVQYKDRVRLHLPSSYPLKRRTEISIEKCLMSAGATSEPDSARSSSVIARSPRPWSSMTPP